MSGAFEELSAARSDLVSAARHVEAAQRQGLVCARATRAAELAEIIGEGIVVAERLSGCLVGVEDAT